MKNVWEKFPSYLNNQQKKNGLFPIYYFSTFKVRNRLKLGSGGVQG